MAKCTLALPLHCWQEAFLGLIIWLSYSYSMSKVRFLFMSTKLLFFLLQLVFLTKTLKTLFDNFLHCRDFFGLKRKNIKNIYQYIVFFIRSMCFFCFCPIISLLDRGLHLPAVDVDGCPAGAVLCHKPVVYGRDVSRINQIMRHD